MKKIIIALFTIAFTVFGCSSDDEIKTTPNSISSKLIILVGLFRRVSWLLNAAHWSVNSVTLDIALTILDGFTCFRSSRVPNLLRF